MNRAGNISAGAAKIHARPLMGRWVDQAACQGLNPDLFHPARGEPVAQAQAICAACPVRTECLDYALTTDQQFGIWGGLSERARRSTPPRRRPRWYLPGVWRLVPIAAARPTVLFRRLSRVAPDDLE